MFNVLNMFFCSEQVDGFPFFERECDIKCWTSEHYTYIGVTGISMLSYMTLTIFISPKYQELPADLNLL